MMNLKQLSLWWRFACAKKFGGWALESRGRLRHHRKKGPGRRHQQGKGEALRHE
jgi:hypothetical protein